MGGEPLCPSPALWRLGFIAWLHNRIVIHLEARRLFVPCPQCGIKASRVHSRYRRRGTDLPWSSWPVQLVVHTRKFFCDNIRCLRRIFTETFPGVLAPYARRTKRMGQALLELTHSSNAESAAWVGGFLGYPTSPDTLLRCQRQEPIHTPTPRVLGVDEFALRRGCTYATILVDQERYQLVDILEGKQARTSDPVVAGPSWGGHLDPGSGGSLCLGGADWCSGSRTGGGPIPSGPQRRRSLEEAATFPALDCPGTGNRGNAGPTGPDLTHGTIPACYLAQAHAT